MHRRRSSRIPGASALKAPNVVKLLDKILTDSPDVEVLKIHNHIGPGASTTVIDAVLEALMSNNNCQALYIQNVNLQDEQVPKLAKVLRRGNIWCLNAGENSTIKPETWQAFVAEVHATNLTHAYLSEHYISLDLKSSMRRAIRENRTKHARHKTASNYEVIRRCTGMWWNPINSKELQAELKLSPKICCVASNASA